MALPSKKLVAGVATAALSAWFSTANAQQNNVMGAVAPGAGPQSTASAPRRQRDSAWEKAQDFSLQYPGTVGFSIYGRTSNHTNQQLVDRMYVVLAECGIKYAKDFTQDEDRMGTAMSFFIEGVPFGPESVGKVMPLIQKVCSVHRDAYPGQHISDSASRQQVSGPVVANN